MRYDKLTMALLNLAERGERTPCSDPDARPLFDSEFEKERAVAIKLCQHCPVSDPGREVAIEQELTWTVRGGIDFSTRPGRPAIGRPKKKANAA
jgi:hypothetical protein